jgi:hypothetical protein
VGGGLATYGFLSQASGVDHQDRGVAVAAVCHADPADRDPVARQRTDGTAEIGRANPVQRFFFVMTLPHLSRSVCVVILIQTIFLLSIFARDPGDHERRAGHDLSTN